MSTQPPELQLPARQRNFIVAIALVAAFSVFLIFNEDPWAFGRFLVTGIAYAAAIVLSISWFVNTKHKRKSALILLIGTLVFLGGVYALSAGNGFPATNVTNSTSYSCTTFTTQTNSSGHPAVGSGFSCTANSVPTENVPLALGYNLLAWIPPVGCALFSMPIWSGKGASRYDNFARLIGGSVPASAIFLNLVGIQSTGSLLSLPVLYLPLNPYLAYGECDSMTATNGCVYVNQLFVLADYAFWLVIVLLTTMTLNEIVSRRPSAPASGIGKPVIYTLALGIVLVLGLAVVPASVAASGVLVSSGDNYSFYPNISFVRIPFDAGHAERLSGAYESSAPVDVYLLNSTQFLSFDSGGGNCPLTSVTPLMINGTGGSISSDVVGSASYSLIFCAPYQFNGPKIQVTITNSIKLTS